MNAAAGVTQIRRVMSRVVDAAATLRQTKSSRVYLQDQDQEGSSWGSSWTRRVCSGKYIYFFSVFFLFFVFFDFLVSEHWFFFMF